MACSTKHTGLQRRRLIEERLWEKVKKDGAIPSYRPDLGPCWEWTGLTSKDGYGILVESEPPYRNVLVHRLSWCLVVGAISDGMVLDHLCRVPNCVNPQHLEEVDNPTNSKRGMAAKMVAHRNHTCLKGHAVVDDNAQPCGKGRVRCRTCSRATARARYRAKAEAANAA